MLMLFAVLIVLRFSSHDTTDGIFVFYLRTIILPTDSACTKMLPMTFPPLYKKFDVYAAKFKYETRWILGGVTSNFSVRRQCFKWYINYGFLHKN